MPMTRACNGCSMCCYLPEIEELSKPVDVWCKHCTMHSCRVYSERPQPCQDFKCAWIADERVADHWYPKRAKMLLYTGKSEDGPEIIVRVHPKHPNRWRQEPYYADIKRFALKGLNNNPRMYTHVMCGDDHWFVLPDRDIHRPAPGVVMQDDLGRVNYLLCGTKEAADALLKFIHGRSL